MLSEEMLLLAKSNQDVADKSVLDDIKHCAGLSRNSNKYEAKANLDHLDIDTICRHS